jgi:hypothetical protein
MKTLKRKSLALPRSPQLMPSPSMAHVNAACRQDFVSFVRKVFHVLNPSATFHMNWHICAIAYYLEQVRLGNTKRLIITVPPRSLKSIMCSVAFPAFALGQDPTKRLIVASYSAELAIKQGMISAWSLIPRSIAPFFLQCTFRRRRIPRPSSSPPEMDFGSPPRLTAP